MEEYTHRELMPLGQDQTPYRLLTSDFVSTVEFEGQTIVKVAPEGLTMLADQAMRDASHLLRPGHLEQVRAIFDDPEASDNDRFVALDMLKNANIAAGGVLPMCQDTGARPSSWAKKATACGPTAVMKRPFQPASRRHIYRQICAIAKWPH